MLHTLLDVLHLCLAAIDFWLGIDEVAADIKRQRRRRRLALLFVGFTIAVLGALVLGRTIQSPAAGVIAGLSFFVGSLLLLGYVLRHRSPSD